MISTKRFIPFLGVILIGLIGCSSDSSQFSPEQIIDNSLKEVNSSSVAYYGEAELTFTDMENKEQTMVMKEWRKDGKTRIEMESKDESEKSISVLNAKMFITYDMNKNQVYIMEDPELLKLNQPSLKDQANFILDLIRDTHEITIEGEEEIVGRDTYHIVAKEKEKNTLLGDQELWIDKENWMVLKMISTSGDSQSTSTYTKIDFKEEVSEDVFTINLPDDVEVINMDELNDTNEVSLEEAASSLGKAFLYFAENDEIKMASVEKTELKGEFDRVEININYMKNDLPLLTLSLFETPEDIGELDTLGGEESITLRGQEGTYTEMGDFRLLSWVENGMSYQIIMTDPNLTLEELKNMVEEMEYMQ